MTLSFLFSIQFFKAENLHLPQCICQRAGAARCASPPSVSHVAARLSVRRVLKPCGGTGDASAIRLPCCHSRHLSATTACRQQLLPSADPVCSWTPLLAASEFDCVRLQVGFASQPSFRVLTRSCVLISCNQNTFPFTQHLPA